MDRKTSDPLSRKTQIKLLAFENAIAEYREVIIGLKVKSAPIDEQIRDMIDVRSHLPEIYLVAEAIP